MYQRNLTVDKHSKESIILFGPQGTGKTYWVKSQFPNALYLDLLGISLYKNLIAW